MYKTHYIDTSKSISPLQVSQHKTHSQEWFMYVGGALQKAYNE